MRLKIDNKIDVPLPFILLVIFYFVYLRIVICLLSPTYTPQIVLCKLFTHKLSELFFLLTRRSTETGNQANQRQM